MYSLMVITSLCFLTLTMLITIRLHYAVYQRDDCRKNVVGGGVHSSHYTTYPSRPTHNASDVLENFQDGYFRPILDAYRAASQVTHIRPQMPRFRSGAVPVAVVYVDKMFIDVGWYDYHIMDIYDGRCPLPCTLTTDITKVRAADAVLIHLNSIRSRKELFEDLGIRDPSQPWIMFEPESPFKGNAMFNNDYRSLNGVFNRTMHYRRDSDIRLLHGFMVRIGRDSSLLPPIWRRPHQLYHADNINSHKNGTFNNNTRHHGSETTKESASQTQKGAVKFTSKIQKEAATLKSQTRKLAVAFVSNCRDQSGRLAYIQTLQKHAPVELYGICGNLTCGHSLYTHHGYRTDLEPCLRRAGHSYLFYLAFENALCEDYVTEKLYNLLYYPMVPVVLGAADYDQLLPPHSYINARHYKPRELANKLLYLARHPQEYARYLKWREYYQPSTVGGSRILCHLCVRLHDPAFYHPNVIQDFYDWYVIKANCNASGTVRDYKNK